MLFFIHILTDLERLTDHQGDEYLDLREATAEAHAAIRAIIAEALLGGGAPPLHWSAQITDEAGSVVATVPFATAFAEATNSQRTRGSDSAHHWLRIERARAAIAQSRRNHAQIVKCIDSLRLLLNEFDRLESDAKETWKD